MRTYNDDLNILCRLLFFLLPVRALSDRHLETRYDLLDVRLVELADRIVQRSALEALYQKLRDFLAAFGIFRFDLPYFPSLDSSTTAVWGTSFGTTTGRPESVRGKSFPMFLQRDPGLVVPDLPLLVLHALPSHTNDFAERAMVRLDIGGYVLRLDEGRAKKNEGIWWTGDVSSRLLLGVFCGSAAGGSVKLPKRGIRKSPDDFRRRGRQSSGGRHWS